jgi:hypothetical protein
VNADKQEVNLQIKARVPRNACHKICVCCAKRHLGEKMVKNKTLTAKVLFSPVFSELRKFVIETSKTEEK